MSNIYELSSCTKNIFYHEDDVLNDLITEVSKIFNFCRCNMKILSTDFKSELSESSESKVFLKLKENIDYELLVNSVIDTSTVSIRKLTKLEELQLIIQQNNNKFYSLRQLEKEIKNIILLISSSKKTLKLVKKMYGELTEENVKLYAYGFFLEQNCIRLQKIETERILTDSIKKYYISINNFSDQDEMFVMKKLLLERVNVIISSSFTNKSVIRTDVEKNIDSIKSTFHLKRIKKTFDEEEAVKEIDYLTKLGSYYLNSEQEIFKSTFILQTFSKQERDRIISILNSMNINVSTLNMLQQEAQCIADISSNIYQYIHIPAFFTTTSQIAELTQLSPQPLIEPRGTLVGKSILGKDIIINAVESEDKSEAAFNSRTSKNVLFCGNMGQGKSYAAKSLLKNSTQNTSLKYIFIIDPENEYENLVESLNGEIIKYSSTTSPNFLYMRCYKKIMDESIYESANSFIDACIEEKNGYLSAVFHLLLDNKVLENEMLALFKFLYRKVLNNQNLEYELSFSESLELAKELNYFEKIKSENPERYINLEKALSLLISFFAGAGEVLDSSNVPPANNVISYSLQNLIRAEGVDRVTKNIVLLSIVSNLFYKMIEARSDGGAGIFLIDECNKVVNDSNTFLRASLQELGTRIRKYDFGMWLVNHTLDDMKTMTNIFKNIQIKFLFYTGDSLNDQMDAYGITKKQYKMIERSKLGNCFVISGNNMSDCMISKSEHDYLF